MIREKEETMKNKKKYIEHNGVLLTEELLDELAEEYEKGTWSGYSGEVRLGRPRFGDEKLVSISLKISPSSLAIVDKRAEEKGETRSDFLRDAIDRALVNY